LVPEAPAEDPERTSSKHLRFFSPSEIPALVPQNYVVTDLAPKVWCSSQTDLQGKQWLLQRQVEKTRFYSGGSSPVGKDASL